MKNSLLIILAIGLLVSGCLKDPNDLGYFDAIEYTGTVVNRASNSALTNIKVELTANQTISTTTDNSGRFSIKIKLDDLNDKSCLIIRGGTNYADRTLSLEASKNGKYEYGAIQLLTIEEAFYEELPTIEFANHTYKIDKVSSQAYTISNALSYVQSLRTGGFSDWYLAPTGLLDELVQYDSYYDPDVSDNVKKLHDLRSAISRLDFWGYEDSEEDGYIIPYLCSVNGNYATKKIPTTEGVAYVVPVRLIR